jgi:hypothetical protein
MINFNKSFAIILDVEKEKKSQNYFKKLINAVSRKLDTAAHRPGTIASRNILKMYRSVQRDASFGDAIFVKDSSFDFELLKHRTREAVLANTKQYNLMRDFEELVELLTSVCRKQKKSDYEIEITIEVPKPKKCRKVTTYDKITILERWVKIGYEMYRRQFDAFSGDEYIVVDGDVYYIKSNRRGQEYLA